MAIVPPPEAYAHALSYVLLDIENCMVPHDCDAYTVPAAITTTMREWGYRGPVQIVAVAANKNRVNSTIVDVLRANHAKVIILKSDKKQASDNHIRYLVSIWTSKHLPPANILLISGDGGFAKTIRHLIRRRYNCMLAYITDSASHKLDGLGSRHTEWRTLLRL